MDKLVWVLLPLAAVATWVGWRAWRRRLPPRPVLNAVFSLLLLAYLLATAGLGLFWVANQHLPVFDWHYLFGYALLVLVALHLVFNLGALRRHLGPGLRARPVPAADVERRPARLAAGVLALLGAVGAAYWMGLRHGRTELRLVVAGSDGESGAGLSVVESFHELSSHSRTGLLRRAASTDWGARPPPFKTDAAVQELALPTAARSAGFGGLLSLQGLSTLLWHTAGISAERGGIHFRTAPSSGALFASEFYLAVRAVPGLAAGVWHYRPRRHALALVLPGPPDAVLVPAAAPAALVATALWRRSGHKYGDRCYRYVLADLGHALENARQTAAALGGGAILLPWFDEMALAQRLRVDEADEGVLAHLLLSAVPMQLLRPARALQPADLHGGAATLGVTMAIHRASSLRGEVAWATAADPAAPASVDPLPLIAARRSHRRYADRPLPASTLQQLLLAMSRPPAQLSDAVRIHVLTPSVQGLARAAWHWDPTQQRLVHARAHDGELRTRARAAALDQEVVGNAAAVVVLGLDRPRFAVDPAGPGRAYRHAFLEAGLLGERLYLQAQALGLGVCAVGAFYDDEAAALVAVDPAREWIVHFAAVGPLQPGPGSAASR
jgi:SagB-type dehydrogenase family enzyme